MSFDDYRGAAPPIIIGHCKQCRYAIYSGHDVLKGASTGQMWCCKDCFMETMGAQVVADPPAGAICACCDVPLKPGPKDQVYRVGKEYFSSLDCLKEHFGIFGG